MKTSERTGIFKRVIAWQKTIAAELSRHQPPILPSIQNPIAIRLILMILALQIDQSNHLPFAKITTNALRTLCHQPDTYAKLLQLWQERFGPLNISEFELPADLQLKDALLQSILSSLFYPDPAAFRRLPIAILGQVYEVLLEADRSDACAPGKSSPSHIKKAGGIYYTPEPIVRSMVAAAIRQYSLSNHPENSLHDSLPNFLDPACGGGAFLLHAYQALLNHRLQVGLEPALFPDLGGKTVEEQRQLSESERLDCLSQIYGVDVDPQAVAIAQLSLGLQFLSNSFSKNSPSDNSLSDDYAALSEILHHNIRCGNSLIDHDFESASPEIRQATRPLHWQTAFPEVFAQGGFDLVVGNPPYVDAEWMTTHLPQWRSYCVAHYQTASGNWDLFCVFIEKALQLCRNQGFTSLIVPNKLLSADYAQAARSLLTQHQIISLQDYAQVSVFDVSVYPLVYLVQKIEATESENVEGVTVYQRMQTIDEIAESYPIELQKMAQIPAAWRIETTQQTRWMQHLEQFPKLGELVQVIGAATVAEAYLLQDKIRNQPQPQPTDLRVINSGTIDRYLLRWGDKPLRYLGQSYWHPVIDRSDLAEISSRRLEQATQPKIIVAGMTQKLECALDQTGEILAGKSTSILLQNHGFYDFRYLLGLLNSDLLSDYFRLRFGGNRLQSNYFRIGPPQLRQLPIALPNLDSAQDLQIYQTMIEYVDQRLIMAANPLNISAQQLDQQIDRLVRQIYQVEESFH